MEDGGQASVLAEKETRLCAIAPGRINLIGEHIDYLGGEVMPAAIDRHIVIEAEPHAEPWCDIVAVVSGEERGGRIDFDDLSRFETPEERWLNYPLGVLALTREERGEIAGFSARITSDLPSGAGLSSSAALATSFSLLVDAFSGIERDLLDRAHLCQRAEHEFAGVPCGIMDQLAVGAGRADAVLRLNCETEQWSYVDLPPEWSLVIADTRVKHQLGDGEYRKRREDCDRILERLDRERFRDLSVGDLEQARDLLGDRLYRRARHVVTEMERVDRFGEALLSRDRQSIGQLLRGSHESLRDDYEVSCPELDALVEAAYEFGPERGLIGSRMTGGGFGGSTISLVARDSAESFRAHLGKNYREKFGRDLDCFITRSVDGASVGPLHPPNPQP